MHNRYINGVFSFLAFVHQFHHQMFLMTGLGEL